MKSLLKKISVFWSDETGAETLEWVLIAAFLTTTIVVAYYQSALRIAVQTQIDSLVSSIMSIIS
jgi:Flp pilus assembly pilin Flp